MNTIKKYFSLLFIITCMVLVAESDVTAQSRGGSGRSGGGRSSSSGSVRSASYRGSSSFSSRPASYSSRPTSYSSRPVGYSNRPASVRAGAYAARPSYGRAGYAARPYGGGYGHAGYRYGYGAYWGNGWRGYYPFYPYFGFRLGILPFGYLSFFIGPDPFYYYDGIYYRPYVNGGYEVVEPPLGAQVAQLPSGAVPTVIDGQIYYVFHGTYYKQDVSADNQLSYIVVGRNGVLETGNNVVQVPHSGGQSAQEDNVAPPPQNKAGDKVNSLPEGSKAIVVNQQKLFVDPSGTYYQEIIEGNQVRYQVVGQSVGN